MKEKLLFAILPVLVCAFLVGCGATDPKPSATEAPTLGNSVTTAATESPRPTETVAPTETPVPTETLMPTGTAAPTKNTAAPAQSVPAETTAAATRPTGNIVPANTTATPTAPTRQLGSTPKKPSATTAPATLATMPKATAPATLATVPKATAPATLVTVPKATAPANKVTAPTATLPPASIPTTQATVSTKPSKPAANPLTVSEEQLKADFLAFMQTILPGGPPHTCTTKDVNILFCSRVDTGCALIIGCPCTSNNPNASWENLWRTAIAELEFFMPNGWYFEFWKDGTYQGVDGLDLAYGNNWLSYGQMRDIWQDFHKQFPAAYEYWKQRNPGLTEPPQRETGLLYRVNEDGKTCTITGTGYYNDPNVVIPETIDGYTVTAIENLRNPNITAVVMPDTVTTIAGQAFIFNTGVRSITFSKNLTSIGSEAFQYCENLEEVILPDSLTQIGGLIFSDCKSLTRAILPKGLTAIPGGMFSGCSALTGIVIPETVTSIGSGAFNGCTSLTDVKIPENVTAIGSSAFQGCLLKEIRLPQGLKAIESSAFAACKYVTQLDIPDSVERIDTHAFSNCLRLTKVTIGKGVTSIHVWAFENCHSLTDITVSPENTAYGGNGTCLVELATKTLIYAAQNCVIPTDGSVTAIGNFAFTNHLMLESIEIPEGIVSIESHAFWKCTALKSVRLPQSLKTINYPFPNCDSLSAVQYNGTRAQWDSLRKSTALGSRTITVNCTDGKIVI